jgi:cytochrome o ubiquinol oxidase operon protein cyoD
MSTNNYFEQIGAWPHDSHARLRAYVTGFVLSIALTLAAYFVAVHPALPQRALFVALLVLACAQFAVQAVYFLHLGRGAASRDRLIVLSAAALIVLILVSGSLWIMFSLNQRMAPDPAQMQQYMNDQQGI